MTSPRPGIERRAQREQGFFENRAKTAADARTSIEILRKMSEALHRPGGSAEGPFDELVAEIGHGQNWYREVLSEAEQTVEQKLGISSSLGKSSCHR